jgi:hypothetical protein
MKIWLYLTFKVNIVGFSMDKTYFISLSTLLKDCKSQNHSTISRIPNGRFETDTEQRSKIGYCSF